MKKKLLFAAAMVASALGFNAQAQSVGDVITVDDVKFKVIGENIITNGSFDDGVSGWKTVGYTTDAVASDFTITETGGFDDGAYITTNGGGVGSAKTIRQSVPVKSGSSYYFSVYTSGKAPESQNFQYNALFKMKDATTEDGVLKQFAWPQGANQTATDWSKTEYVFTADEAHPYVGVRMGWNQNSKFDGFVLVEVEIDKTSLWEAALAAAKTAQSDEAYSNVGGSERAALDAIISNYEEDPGTNYQAIAEEINAATDAFKAAKTAYDLAASTPELPYADPNKAPVIDETTVAADLLVALRAYYESNAAAEGVEGAVDMRDKILNNNATDGNNSWTWTGNKNNPRNTESWTDSEGNHTYMYFDGGNWSGTGWTTTMEQAITLPAGRYLLTAKGRASDGVTLTMSVGEESVALPNVNASGNVFNFGWNDGFVVFETDGNAVTIKINATTEGNHQWFSVGDFRLMQLEAHIDRAALLAAINNATAAKDRLNVGEDVFQIPTSAATTLEGAIATAQAVYENESATVAEVEAAIKAINDAVSAFEAAPLNAPAPGNKYGITIVTEGHPYKGNAIVAGNGATSGNNPTGNFFNVKGENPNFAQTFTFTAAEDAEGPNLYYISVELPEGTVYLTNGTKNGSAAGWAPSQIQGTTDSNKRLAFRIAASTTVEGAFNIINTANDYNVVAQNGGNIYTDENAQQNGEFALVEPTLVEVPVVVAAGKFATRIYPFKPAVANDGVVYYSCEAAEENELTLSEVAEPAANVPYILEAKLDVNETQQGYSIAGANTYTDGWLTGVFASTTITEGYVLQTNKETGKQAFYIVKDAINVPAFRAYLNKSDSSVKSFNLGDGTTGISALEALTNNAFEAIYSADGVKLNRIEKGVNILKMSDGTTRKVILK